MENSKGRYGYLVNIFTTIFDFVLLNLVYLFIIYNNPDGGQFCSKAALIFLNVSYCPAIFLFSEVHKKRVLFVDKIMIMLLQTFRRLSRY